MTELEPALKLGLMSDLHLAARQSTDGYFHNPQLLRSSRGLFETGLTSLRGEADALLILGDLSDRARLLDYRYMFRTLADHGAPTFLVHGNHDLPVNLNHERDSALTHAASRQATPTLTRLLGTATRVGPFALEAYPLTKVSEGYSLELPSEEIESPRDLRILASHFPLISAVETCASLNWPYPGDLVNRQDALESLYEREGPVIVVSGHLHLRGHQISRNVLQLHMAALIEPPHDTDLLTVTAREGGNIEVWRRSNPLMTIDEASSPLLDPTQTCFRWDGRRWTRANLHNN